MINRWRTFILCMLLPLLAAGQQKEFRLHGYATIKDGPECRYDVLFTTTGNTLSGNSITTQPDGTEMKTGVKGVIDRVHKTVTFREFRMQRILFLHDCMFDVKLSYKLTRYGYYFTGSFIGYDADGKYCDEGTVKMESKDEPSSPFAARPPKKEPVKPADTATAKQDAPGAFSKVTAASQKELEWHTDSCVLEIWDGEVVDNDIVTISLNGSKVLNAYSLTAGKKRLVLPLHGKTNTLTIFAENEGQAPPNTAMILLTDGAVQNGVLSCIKKGEAAVIVLRKK